MFERRNSPRVELVSKVQTEVTGFSFLAAAGNLSAGGMLIFTGNPSSPGVVLRLEFSLPDSPDIISAAATVVRVEPGTSMAVRFDELKPGDLAAIRQFVEKSKQPE